MGEVPSAVRLVRVARVHDGAVRKLALEPRDDAQEDVDDLAPLEADKGLFSVSE